MRSARTIFIKQAIDTARNPMVLVMFVIFPVVALIMTQLIALPNDDIPNNMFVTMMGAIFAGMGLITSMASIIAEDSEHKSLRFLVMAGVKPQEYLIGTGGFILLAGTIASLCFALIGDFSVEEFLKFFTVMVLSTTASIILGATIGMLAKNQQAATALGLPLAMIIGFTPMIATFNETVERVSSVLYTQQLNVIVNDFSENFSLAVLVIVLNILVFAVLFILAYKKRGLRG